ncbi:T9SS type A sorting domain-containing protein [Aurantibacillus circumpalustris]|uniref:T9SS type A sorting domain-containing protein n=1 Tax=Aurantibacillus circumpalustris TaxID=3036359 RepID=UPI00295B1D16|nr:T9SS type A sorting domain-containing protein [Aurantibacillus circumpalustris]
MFRNFVLFLSVFITSIFFAQEGTKPLSSNLNYIYKNLRSVSLNPKTDVQQQKTSAGSSLSIPFIEDFSYSPVNNYPDQNRWEDSLVYVNSGMATAPPSIGVATFDGLNKHGYPYKPTLTNLTLSNPADTLTSKPINLHTVGSQTLLTTDNIAISFYYQARGKGDNPELNDSLILDFYKPLAHADSAWSRVWFKQGSTSSNTNDSAFKRAFVKITDTAYLHDGFRFRFRNWASVTGNFDHWHIDYIFLNKDRGNDSIRDTIINDITFCDIPTSFLKDYSEMPLQQYQPSEMAKSLSVKIRNNSADQPNMFYKYKVYDNSGNQIFSEYTGGSYNINPFRKNTFSPPNYGYQNYQPHAFPNIKDTFIVNQTMSSRFKIKHFIYLDANQSSSSDTIRGNDTVIQYQNFRNFYAFDDGSAEAGYYVNAIGAKMAVKIKLNKPDTLYGLRIYFDPVGNVSSISNTATTIYNFSINVWGQDNNGAPDGLNNILKDNLVHHPIYIQDGFKEVPEFKLKQPFLLQAGTYFIGIQQASSILTVGFDRNYNHKSSLYFDSGSGWTQSNEDGSIMINPLFGTYLPIVGINEIGSSPISKNFFVYPNPSTERFTIVSAKLQNSSYQLFNSVGQLVKEEIIDNTEQVVSVSNFLPGIYILILKNNGHAVQQQKIIVQH